MNTPVAGLNPIYEEIVREWEEELEDIELMIFRSLKKAFPNGRTRRELIFDVYGVNVDEGEDLNNNKMDRKIRMAISDMREKLIPVFSSSGEAGYRLEISEIGLSLMVNEWQRRREAYDDKIRRGNVLIQRVKQLGNAAIPVDMIADPKQLAML